MQGLHRSLSKQLGLGLEIGQVLDLTKQYVCKAKPKHPPCPSGRALGPRRQTGAA